MLLSFPPRLRLSDASPLVTVIITTAFWRTTLRVFSLSLRFVFASCCALSCCTIRAHSVVLNVSIPSRFAFVFVALLRFLLFCLSVTIHFALYCQSCCVDSCLTCYSMRNSWNFLFWNNCFDATLLFIADWNDLCTCHEEHIILKSCFAVLFFLDIQPDCTISAGALECYFPRNQLVQELLLEKHAFFLLNHAT